jgi:hypothetical protein
MQLLFVPHLNYGTAGKQGCLSNDGSPTSSK